MLFVGTPYDIFLGLKALYRSSWSVVKRELVVPAVISYAVDVPMSPARTPHRLVGDCPLKIPG